MNPREFEESGREKLQNLFKVPLRKRKVGTTKEWDYVSEGDRIIGDAKLFIYGGSPGAQLSIISEHVWLLEKTPAKAKFLLFGGSLSAPFTWLRRWRKLLAEDFFFFHLEGDKLQLIYGPSKELQGAWDGLVDSRSRWRP